MKSPDRNERARRDWTLLIFIIPIGIILMLVAGQIAIRLVPFWSVDAEMRSRVSLDYAPGQQLFAPLLPSILTPFDWLNTILTPGTDGYDIVSDFVILDPSLTPPISLVIVWRNGAYTADSVADAAVVGRLRKTTARAGPP